MGAAEPGLDGQIQCGFCGFRDQLPADQLARALEVKSRLTSAKNSVANVSGMENALSDIFEKRSAFWSVAGLYIVAAVLITGNSLLQARPIIAAAPEGVKLALFLNALMGGMYIGGIALSLLIAFAVGRFMYRRNVRTQLFARLPRQEGLPARCRACDGGLADRRTPFILCEFCGTKNLVTKELQANRQMLLERERAFYAQRAGQALGGMRGTSINMSRVLVVCMVLVYVAIIGFAAFASSTISTG